MSSTRDTHDRGLSVAALWASAFVILALVIVQADRSGVAKGDMTATSGGYAVLTTDGGSDEPLMVIDQRRELLLVYQVENQTRVLLRQRVELPQLFADARDRAEGRQ